MKKISWFLLLATAVPAQIATPPAAMPLHLTVNFPKASVISAEFGSLPKDIVVAEVSACNDTQCGAGVLLAIPHYPVVAGKRLRSAVAGKPPSSVIGTSQYAIEKISARQIQ